MSSRRRLPLAVSTVACLLLAAGASAADPVVGLAAANGYTAAATPTHVKPATSASYTVTLTNDPSSSTSADRAKVGIPPGFGSATLTQATTSAAGGCVASTWSRTDAPGTIELIRPGGNDSSLCPGATLTVVFSVTSAPTEGNYTWATELFRGPDTVFELQGSQPTVVVDGTAPQVTITEKPSNPSNVRSPTFAFAVSESATVACRLDAGAFAPCSSPTSYGDLADAPHTFAVKATDPAGNAGPEASYTWMVDTVAPTVVIAQKPSNPSSTSSATFVFTASQNGSSFFCRLDNEGAFIPCSSPGTYSNLSDGPHIFSVKATDPAGNVGPDVPYGWTIETRAPTATVTLAPAGLSNSRSAIFGFTADEPSTFECKQDDHGFEPCTSPASYVGLADGPHVFYVRARDAVGNMSVPVSRAWTIDATAPETTLASRPASGTAASATFTFSASEPSTFECRLGEASLEPCTSPKRYSGLRVGRHRFEVRAIDAAGNVDPTAAIHSWTMLAATRRVATRSALFAPRIGARVTAPPLLQWRRVKGASYYNVQLYKGRQKLLSTWPVRPRLRLRAGWSYLGRNRRLVRGHYRWYVWPGYGTAPKRRYGRLLGESTFTVVAATKR